MEEKDTTFKNINYNNKTVSKSIGVGIDDIDVDNELTDQIVDSSKDEKLDLSAISSFTNVSRSRDEVYSLLDSMGADPIISSALEIYASDVCEPNDKGEIVWAESDDEKILNEVNYLIKRMKLDKNSYDNVYSLCKYGDIYLRLFRESDYSSSYSQSKDKEKEKLNEDVIVKAYSKNDKYSGFVEKVKNPAEMFDLTRYGKSYGYLKTNITSNNLVHGDDQLSYGGSLLQYTFKKDDVDIYPATEFAHACLEDSSSRVDEEVSIFQTNDETEIPVTYSIKRGQSILYNSFKIWKELSLLENSILLNRVTRSSIVRALTVEVGDMDKNAVRSYLQKIKGLIEQKSSINVGKSLSEYTNPGPMDNIIYIPVHEGKGAISATQIGGDGTEVGGLEDLDYWKKKLFASLGIPGQYLGDTDDNTGFNGGSSLSLISSRYAKNIKRIQSAYTQVVTDIVNMMLYDEGLIDYIGKFRIKMQSPSTQEEKDRKDGISTAVNNISSIMGLLGDIQEPAPKLEILKSLLSETISNVDVITVIQEEIDKLIQPEEVSQDESSGEEDTGSGEMSGGESGSGEFGEESTETSDEGGSTEIPEEGGESGGDENLPSFDEMGVSYDEA